MYNGYLSKMPSTANFTRVVSYDDADANSARLFLNTLSSASIVIIDKNILNNLSSVKNFS